MIRTFIAVTLPVSTVEEIAKVQTELRTIKTDIRWVRVENMHLTLKFLGEIGRSRVAPTLDLQRSTFRAQPAFSVVAQGRWGIPNHSRPRVIWAGLIGGTLTAVGHAAQTALVSLDFPIEKRPFKPHITLGRVRSLSGWSDILPHVQRHQHTCFGESIVNEVMLYHSDLQPSGVYTRLGTIALQAL